MMLLLENLSNFDEEWRGVVKVVLGVQLKKLLHLSKLFTVVCCCNFSF